MSQTRFRALLLLLGVVVATSSFVFARSVLDTGAADPPPPADRTDVTTGGAVTTTAAPSSTTTAPTAPGDLAAPAWIAVVSSAGGEADATTTAQALADAGHPSGVLHSDDYPSLEQGFWVAYAGPYPDRDAAEAALDELAADGFEGAYVRCAGTRDDCGREGHDDD